MTFGRGQHYLDPVQYILGKDEELPVTVEIDADKRDDDAVGSWRRVTYTYQDGTQTILAGENKDKNAAFTKGSEGRIMKGFQSEIPGFLEKVDSLTRSSSPAHRFSQGDSGETEVRAQRGKLPSLLHFGQPRKNRAPHEQKPRFRPVRNDDHQ